MNNRKKILDFINYLEKKYQVNDLKCGSVVVWPLIRIRLYFYLIFEHEVHLKEADTTRVNRINVWSRGILLLNSLVLLIRLMFLERRVDVLYAGSFLHRVNFRGKAFNRFFDPLIDKGAGSLIVEYQQPSNKIRYYKRKRVIELFVLFPLFFHLTSKVKNRLPVNVLGFVKEELQIEVYNYFNIQFPSDQFSKNLDIEWHRIIAYKNLFDFLFKCLGTREAVGLCYYNTPMLGMNLAARELGINSCDYQHGAQGPYHLGYAGWTSVPKTGYELLPSKFYCWGSNDVNEISKWAERTMGHQAIVKGNSWADFWKEQGDEQSNLPDNIILYTLQPIADPLEAYILKTIKETSGKFVWWIRLHPRQLSYKSEVNKQIDEWGLSKYVNVDEASTLPLPQILGKTKIHITKFSGSFVEATEFNVPSIIIDERGYEAFEKISNERLHRFVLDRSATSLKNAIGELLNRYV